MAKTPFLDAAERCDQLGRSIKEKQFGATGVDAFPVEAEQQGRPEEAWARRFATHVFRPIRSEAGLPPLSQFMATPTGMPRMPDLASVAESRAPVRGVRGGHIGAVLGKAGPGRGWLGRLFRR